MRKPNRGGKRSFIIKNKKSLKKLNGEQYYKQYDEMAFSTNKKEKIKKTKKVLLIILCIFLALVLIVGAAFAGLYYSGQFADKNHDISIPAEQVEDNGDVVKNNGTTYVYDEDVTTILCIGVDKDEQTQIKTENFGTAGQADALFLLCIDTNEKKYTVLSINRDSMIDIDVYNTSGKFVGIKTMQACTSFAYGDGKEESCKNVQKTISRLLYNIPIDSYFSINKASIPLLNDIVYGVDVPVYDQNGNVTGEITHLEGGEAYDYIHYRDISRLDSNVIRLERQKSYIKAFASKVIAQTKEDLSTPLQLFETIKIYSTTDLNASKITYLTTNAFSDRKDINLEFKSVPGTVVEGKSGYAEYNVDKDALMQVVLDIFYDKQETEQQTKGE